LPFADALLLQFKFEKHGDEFPFATEAEYEAAADAFMSQALTPPARECVRESGDRVRFNRTTRFLAVQAPSGFLKTFHRPSDKYMKLGYFRWECGRTDLG
jgi:pyocin large subunit-like protein